MTSTNKNDGISSPSTPNSSTGSSGHKNSLKGTKLARRARSFKDDIFEKISQMRTPTSTLGRSHSPHSPRSKQDKSHHEDAKPTKGLAYDVQQIKNALKHFKDVISKNKLEVLPGNGTIVLELIANMYASLQQYTLNENSNTLICATTQVYYSLGKLIKLCDEVLLSEDEQKCPSLSNENVKEVVDLVENAVQNLVNIVNEKVKERENSLTANNSSLNTLLRPSVDVAGQRTSLPDIPLTPKERDTLEKSSSNPIRTSHSTESILRDSSPPPKPPLPNRIVNPPPLPPKRRSQPKQNSITNETDFNVDSSLLSCGLDHLSMRSRSPDDNSSILSASAGSLDSAFNQSREEEELKGLTMDISMEDQFLDDGFAAKTITNKKDNYEKSLQTANVTTVVGKNQRNSNESGFASMQSIRASMQSISTKRSSEHSTQSHKSSIASSTELTSLKKFDQITNDIDKDQLHLSSQTKSLSCFSNQSVSSVEHCVTTSCNFLKTVNAISKTNSLDIALDDVFAIIPPELPVKARTRSTNKERHVSHYDNVEETDHVPNFISRDDISELRPFAAFNLPSKHQSLIEPRRYQTYGDHEEPPPLPEKKKKHNNETSIKLRSTLTWVCFNNIVFQSVAYSVIAYMEICSASQRTTEHMRHSVHTYNITHSSEHFSPNRNISHSQTMNLSPRKQLSSQSSPITSPNHEKPPALPPKKQRGANCKTPTIITTPPPSPKPGTLQNDGYDGRARVIGSLNAASEMSTVNEETNEMVDDEKTQNNENSYNVYGGHEPKTTPDATNDEDEGIDVVLRNNSINKQDCSPSHSIKMDNMPNLLEEIDISNYLIFKKEGEDGPDVKGGYLDALIVHASKVQNGDTAFSEAFITTFRTFITPLELINKLISRYTVFSCQVIDQKQKAAKETFSLLVRVVNDLTLSDLTTELLFLLSEFVYNLVCSGHLLLAKLLRNKIVEKATIYKDCKSSTNLTEQQRDIVKNLPSLLDLKSVEIAEQMTLLDAELFQKIEIPEVLLFAKEQCEEKSPNLNKFTEHFNKMSYWARSQILKQDDAKDRERHVIKFIKIMKHLRKINNYNSYLALLSALDSAPIRRLEWHKTITEGLKEYCALIDSSSSFRIYRQALAETNPPCIPYIGLVLQDLTFVHVGNPDYLKDCIINFSKRWQQHNIIVNMKRFKKCAYPFRRNEKIIRFFENFENYLGEEQMWQISENIKPRGRKPVQH